MARIGEGRYDQSITLYDEACHYLAGGVSSNFRLGGRPAPLFFERASGSRLFDADGNEYIDYALGMGPCILGHAPESVIAAVAESLGRGQLYAGQHETELQLARKICELVPCAELVRFGMSGSEVEQAAIRVARAYTGRNKVVKFEGHYHGWFDNVFASVHPSLESAGPYQAPHTVSATQGQDLESLENLIVLPWNDEAVFAQTLKAEGSSISAVIMEPILCNTCVILPKPGYLQNVRELCTQRGIVLIFDEVITGFRVGLGGAQALLKVTPDLAVFAKAFGAGFPISCLGGKRELMEMFAAGKVMHGGTYNANTVSCAAALATLTVLSHHGGAAYSQMESLGKQLMAGLETQGRASGLPLRVQGLGTVFHTCFTPEEAISQYREYLTRDATKQTRFVELLQDRGIRITPRGTWFLSTAHSEQDVHLTLERAKSALQEL